MTNLIEQAATKRRIMRLCHFTLSRNLVHIATDPKGLRSTKDLADDEADFTSTDIQRVDGFTDHVCCSIMYPNVWYLEMARDRMPQEDWVVLFIKTHYLWKPGTKFCQCNAATEGGARVSEGIDAFNAMFEQDVSAKGNSFKRKSYPYPSFLPTDLQAEVLIPGSIAREDLLGIAFSDETRARDEDVRLKALNIDVSDKVIAPAFFNKEQFVVTLRRGLLPYEKVYTTAEYG